MVISVVIGLRYNQGVRVYSKVIRGEHWRKNFICMFVGKFLNKNSRCG